MRRFRSALVVSMLAAVPLAFAACKQEAPKAPAPPPAAAPAPAPAPAQAPFRVTSVELGNAIGPDKRVATPTASFAPGDTIYASVASDGRAPSVTLSASWTYGTDATLVNETSQSIASSGPAVTEFHISNPKGWPPGSYRVSISANGSQVATKDFEVRAP